MIQSAFNTMFVLWMVLIIHELGHAMVAVAFGRKVTEFVIGAHGPKLFKRKIKDLGIVVGWFPLGGHVIYRHSLDWRVNAAVMLAGPFANILSALLVVGALIFSNPSTDFQTWGPFYVIYSLIIGIKNLLPSIEGSDGDQALRCFKRHVRKVWEFKEFVIAMAYHENGDKHA
jgi:membrane-associated protease RseP (regulator of RpoE activity)